MFKLAIILLALIANLGLPLANSDVLNKEGERDLNLGISMELKLNEKVQFGESLSIVLVSFTHKRPKIGGPAKATAYILLSRGGDSDEESLSVYGVDGTELRKYGRIQWNEYEIQLKSFDYNRSIELIVNKVK